VWITGQSTYPIYIIIVSYHQSWLPNDHIYGSETLHADPSHTWPTHGLGQISLRGHPFEKNFTFFKILQPHSLSRSRAVTSYKRRHHGDASWASLLRTGEPKTSCTKMHYCNFLSRKLLTSPPFFSCQCQLSVKFQVFDSVAVYATYCTGLCTDTRSISVSSSQCIQFAVTSYRRRHQSPQWRIISLWRIIGKSCMCSWKMYVLLMYRQ